MMKAVPLALLLASGAMAGPLEGSWVAGTVPTGASGSSACCYPTAGTTVTISGTALTTTIDASTNSAACANYIGASGKQMVSPAADGKAFADTLATSAAGTSVLTANGAGGSPATAQGNGLTVTTTDGTGLTWTPSSVTSGGTCTAQPLTRASYTITGLTASTQFTPGTGTYPASGTCCLYDTTEKVTIAPANGKVTVTGKLGGTAAQCSTTGSSPTVTLKPTSTAGTYTDLTGANTYVVTNSGATVTLTTSTSGCTQVLTAVSSSAIHLAGATAIVGATVLGMVAI